MAGELDNLWVDNDTRLTAANFNMHINRSHVNLLRNGSFETWADDGFNAGDTPSCWEWSDNTGTLSRDATTSTRDGTGKYLAKVVMASGTTDTLHQDLTPLVQNGAWGSEYVTIAAKCQNSAGSSKMRLYIEDDVTGKQYSSYIGASWGWVYITVQLNASAVELKAGIEYQGGIYNGYVDDIMLVRGQLVPYFTPHPADYGIVCNEWDNDGTVYPVQGGLRIVPFKKTGTLTGGDTFEAVLYSIPADIQPEYILSASADVSSLATSDEREATVSVATLATTSISLAINLHTGGNLAAEAYQIEGHWLGIGYADNTKAHGAY